MTTHAGSIPERPAAILVESGWLLEPFFSRSCSHSERRGVTNLVEPRATSRVRMFKSCHSRCAERIGISRNIVNGNTTSCLCDYLKPIFGCLCALVIVIYVRTIASATRVPKRVAASVGHRGLKSSATHCGGLAGYSGVVCEKAQAGGRAWDDSSHWANLLNQTYSEATERELSAAEKQLQRDSRRWRSSCVAGYPSIPALLSSRNLTIKVA